MFRRRSADRKPCVLWRSSKRRARPSHPWSLTAGTIGKTFWGKAWCDNLERYSDYGSRLPRGRTYARNGSVIDLQIGPGAIHALVSGSDLYHVTVQIKAVPEKHWNNICTDCSGAVDSLVELLQGRLSKSVMERICHKTAGLFPSPGEIEFSCTCPDWAGMCKHVAAVLYGVGARFDQQPELLFKLREVNQAELIASAGKGLPLASAAPGAKKLLGDEDLAAMFGLDMAESAAPASARVPAKAKALPVKAKKTSKAAASRKASKKPAPGSKPFKGRNSPKDPESGA